MSRGICICPKRGRTQCPKEKNPDKQEICYDDIYNEIEARFASAKEIELNWELMVLQSNPEMKILWDYALELNKKVIVISDMYHSYEDLSQLLIKNEFHAFEHLYVSSCYGKTKKKGTLFEQVFQDLQVKPQDIVHIGDNKKGDFRTPAKLGIQAILYKQVAHQFLAINERARRFAEQNVPSLGKSILVAMLAIRWRKQTCNKTVVNIGTTLVMPMQPLWLMVIPNGLKQQLSRNNSTIFYLLLEMDFYYKKLLNISIVVR
ncbi:HAD-IA family hydrolase [Acinetobacter vivianii]